MPGATTPHSRTLSRGIRVLEVLAESPLTIQGLAQALDVHRSIVYRILRTLEDHGLVARDAAGLVSLAPRMAALARGVERNLQSAALHRAGITGRPPEHRVPSAEAFVRAIADGIGWGMVPRLQLPGAPFAAADTPLLPVPGLHPEAVSLHLQRWSTALPALALLEDAVRRGARALL